MYEKYKEKLFQRQSFDPWSLWFWLCWVLLSTDFNVSDGKPKRIRGDTRNRTRIIRHSKYCIIFNFIWCYRYNIQGLKYLYRSLSHFDYFLLLFWHFLINKHNSLTGDNTWVKNKSLKTVKYLKNWSFKGALCNFFMGLNKKRQSSWCKE